MNSCDALRRLKTTDTLQGTIKRRHASTGKAGL